jgi:hypothetical protein
VCLHGLQHPLVDQQSALQALAIARRHGLAAAACNLARRISAAEERRGHMACALQWALQARDPQRCAQLVAPLIVKILDLLSPEVRPGAGKPADSLYTFVNNRLGQQQWTRAGLGAVHKS